MKLFRSPWFWLGVGAGLAVLALIWAAYRFSWPGTGFQGKTVWDWLQLLIIPAALALIALLFNQANTRVERGIAQKRYEQDQQIALDKQREDLLQAYIDRMSELLLEKGLRTSQADAEVRNVARTRTISVLRQLDARRVGDVFTFLGEAGLADLPDPIISLKGADLSEVNWARANLMRAALGGVDFSGANLQGANLKEANLRGADLYKADLQRTSLGGADLQGAKLGGANLRGVGLGGADLRGAILRGANFSGIRMRTSLTRKGLVLFRTFLGDAILSGADLSRANLSEAILSGADLSGAKLKDAILSGAILKGATIDKSQLTPEQIAQAIWDKDVFDC